MCTSQLISSVICEMYAYQLAIQLSYLQGVVFRFLWNPSSTDNLKSVMDEHFDQVAELVQKLSSELRTGFRPAIDNFLGFFHAIDWKEPWLMGLLAFHVVLLLVVIISRKHTNFQMCLFLLALAGVYLAERLNGFLGKNWKSFAGQNYFDTHGLFLSVLWSGPLLVIAMIILVGIYHHNLIQSTSYDIQISEIDWKHLDSIQINTLFSLCYMIVRWKRAELRHRARLARSKEE